MLLIFVSSFFVSGHAFCHFSVKQYDLQQVFNIVTKP